MNAKSFQTIQALSDYQADRELREALAVQSMTPTERFQWLSETWGRLQDGATILFAEVSQRPATARSYASMEEKNRFDEDRELELALRLAIKRG